MFLEYMFLSGDICSIPFEPSYDIHFTFPFLSECRLASSDSPCSHEEANDLKYELTTNEHCCCNKCSSWIILECVPDSTKTTGSRIWQISRLCPKKGCGISGKFSRNTFFLVITTYCRYHCQGIKSF